MIHTIDRYGILGNHAQSICRRIRSEHRRWFEHLEKVSMAAHDLLPQMQPRQFDTQGLLVTTLFVRGLSQFQATCLLCANGMPFEAKIVLRSFMELVIDLRAIDQSKWLTWHYVKEHDRERLRMVNKIARSEYLTTLLPTFDPVKEKKTIHEHLGPAREGPSLELFAEAADMKDTYLVAYTTLCDTVHSGVQDLQKHLDAHVPEKVKGILYGVSDDALDDLLLTTSELMLAAINGVVHRFSLRLSEEAQYLYQDHITLAQHAINQQQPAEAT